MGSDQIKMSLKIVVALVWAAALCSAQNGPAQSIPIPPGAISAPVNRTQGGKPGAKVTGQKPETAATTATKKAPYLIGPLDVLSIRVWNNANLSGLVDVRSDGMMSLPLIGEVKAEGLTVQQLKDTIADADHLGKIMVEPIVDIQVAKINSKRYFVYGEGANHNGEFPLIEATTILDAVATFGGFREFAKTNKIYLMRGAEKHDFNYKEISKGKNLEQNIEIQNGDRIYVP
jgi:polysaccharide export outer membrane protein